MKKVLIGRSGGFIVRILIPLFSIALCVTPAAANFVSYSEWSALPEDQQSMYMAGAISLVTFVSTSEEGQIAQHRDECLAKSGMTTKRLSRNVLSYAATKPDLQGGSVQKALVRYLLELCGLPK
jgi:hypothetical protein